MRRTRLIIGLILASLIGTVVGVGGFTFVYANGASYLQDSPRACANCHIMNEQYNGWTRSSHHAVATCNDCHTPHDFLGKYMTKARNGFNHSLAFTLGGFPEPIQITPRNREITEAACRHCHAEITQAIDTAPRNQHQASLSCIRCHSSVGHLHGQD